MTDVVLGLDTSNYRTSLAAVDLNGHILLNERELLPVAQGERGLRQSDAVYLHLKQIKGMETAARKALCNARIVAVAASAAPRGREDSYMPVFEVGETVGRMIAAAESIPFFRTDHQRGHLWAARRGTALDKASAFLALHLSGGTTDLLCFRDGDLTELGSSLDLHAGQLVDRIGVAMGLPFPAGAELEKLAEKGKCAALLGCSMAGEELCCHFSGAETKVLAWIRDGQMRHQDIALEVYDLLARTIARMLAAGGRKSGMKDALLCGGVASSALFRRMLTDRLARRDREMRVCFGDPALSGDNAVGVALIGMDAYKCSKGQG